MIMNTAIPSSDREVLRQLGRELAEAAADPVNDERRRVHEAVDQMQTGRPSITFFQEPWNELEQTGELDMRCVDPFCQGIERDLRRKLYKWRHHPGDMVVAAESIQPYCIEDSGFGISEQVDIVKTDAANNVVSRHFHIQIQDEGDIEKIKMPVISHNTRLTEELYQKRNEIFDGILSVRKQGITSFWFVPWDELICWTGIQEILMDLALRPDYVHKLVSRLVDCWLSRVDQLEAQGLLEQPAREMTVSGAAQIFSEVSPEMHGEFALQHEARFFKRFKRVHYGCCEPLHNKVDICAQYLPNLYQISMSPWVDFRKGAQNVRNRFIFGWRPHPAMLAGEHWDPGAVRRYLEENLAIAHEYGCTVAMYMKDISTVNREPKRLEEWNKIAKECVSQYAV